MEPGFDFTSAPSPLPDFTQSEPSLLVPTDNAVSFTEEPVESTGASLLDSLESATLATPPPSSPSTPHTFPEFKKLQDQRFAEIKERDNQSAQTVQERKAAAAETRKQMKAQREKAIELRKAKNREDEKEFISQRDATLSAGKDWQRVSNLLDVTAKTESTRMRDVLVSLKQ